jgi:radical SAM protein with 4Fe4S-binding SPASM domain
MNNFCHNIFSGLSISPSGTITPCCKFINNDKTQFHIKDGINSYKNSEWLNNLKKQFLDGKKPKGCNQCWNDEKAGIRSKRQLDYERHKNIFDNIDLKNSKFININLAFGNYCNLACRICSPNSSSKWASEKKKEDGKDYPIHAWYKNPKIMQDIWQLTSEAIHIDIPGGEPLLIDITEHFEYLEKFVNDGRAGEISLHYTSNGSTYPKDSHLKIWKKFKEVDLQLSIDDTHQRFEYNRWPASWNNVYQNIKKYQEFKKSSSNFKLSISHSISVFTILYVDQFFKWCIRENLPAPWMGLVSFPSYYNPSVLPGEVKKQVSSVLDQSKIKEVRKLKDYLEYDNSQYFNQFLSVTHQLDTIRNQNFQTTFPELAELIRHYI